MTRCHNPELPARCPDRAVAAVYHVGARPPSLATVETLARLQLVARRDGVDIGFCHVSPRLREVLSLCGLTRALAVSVVQPRRQPEQREQPRGVEEGVEPDDLPP